MGSYYEVAPWDAKEQWVPFATEEQWGVPTGSLLGFPKSSIPMEWKRNYEFTATMTFHGFERGQSAAHAIWHDAEGRQFQMFLVELGHLLQTGSVQPGGHVTGTWTFMKRGANYGLHFVSVATDAQEPT